MSWTPSTSLPSPQQVREHLERHPARTRTIAIWLPTVILLLVLLIALSGRGGAALVLPWIVLLAMLAAATLRMRYLRGLERQVMRVQELAMLRQPRQTLDEAWNLVPRLATMPEQQARVIALLSSQLAQLKAHESAIAGYDFLADRLPEQHPASYPIRLHRAIAQLACDHLADADSSLRKLRMLDELEGTPLHAAYRFATLYQCVRTRHFDDAVAMAPRLLETLRPLGVEAGYGHGLMALSFVKLAEKAAAAQELPARPGGADPLAAAISPGDAAGEHRKCAATWWSRATLLLPVGELVDRFADLDAIAKEPVMAAAARTAMPQES
jgi:hypothetical protein